MMTERLGVITTDAMKLIVRDLVVVPRDLFERKAV